MISTDPLRPPDWRWQEAMCYANTCESPYDGDDKLTADLVEFLREVRKNTALIRIPSKTYEAIRYSRELQKRFGNIYVANKLRTSDSYLKYALEAYVIANADPALISARIGVEPAAVVTYELIFLDIRDRLKSDLFIVSTFLTPLLQKSRNNLKDCDFLWKGLGYFHGTEALDSFISMKPMTDMTSAKVSEVFRSELQKQALSALMLRGVDASNADVIIEEYTNIVASKEDPNSHGGNSDKLLSNLLNAINPSLTAESAVAPPRVEKRVSDSLKDILKLGEAE